MLWRSCVSVLSVNCIECKEVSKRFAVFCQDSYFVHHPGTGNSLHSLESSPMQETGPKNDDDDKGACYPLSPKKF